MKTSLKVTVYFSCFPPKRRACDGSILFNVNRDDGGGLSLEQLISDQRSTQEHAIVIDDAPSRYRIDGNLHSVAL